MPHRQLAAEASHAAASPDARQEPAHGWPTSTEWVEVYDIVNAPKDYRGESARLAALIDAVHPDARTLLDVACGTGGHLEFLQDRFEVDGLDLDPVQLRAAGRRLRGARLHEGDLATFDLGRTFDVVTCLYGSIGLLRDLEGVRQAIRVMAAHLAPDGVLFIKPWLTPSAFRDDELHQEQVFTPRKAVSYMYVQRREGRDSVLQVHYLVGSREGGVTHFVDTVRIDLYTDDEYRGAFRDGGLDVHHAPWGLHGYGAYVGREGRAWRARERRSIATHFGRRPRRRSHADRNGAAWVTRERTVGRSGTR